MTLSLRPPRRTTTPRRGGPLSRVLRRVGHGGAVRPRPRPVQPATTALAERELAEER